MGLAIRILLAFLVFSTSAFGATYYLRYDGTGDDPDCSEDSENSECCVGSGDVEDFNATIFSTGDIILVCDDVSFPLTSPLLMNDDGVITLKPAPGNYPKFDCNDTSTNGIVITGDYNVVGGTGPETIEVYDSTQYGVFIDSALVSVTGVTIQNVVCHDSGWSGIQILNATSFTSTDHVIQDCISYDNEKAGFGIYGYGDISDILVRRNLAYGNNKQELDHQNFSAAVFSSEISAAAVESGTVYYNTTPAAIMSEPERVIYYGGANNNELELFYEDTSGVYANLSAHRWDYDADADLLYFNLDEAASAYVWVFYGSIDDVIFEDNESRNCTASASGSDGDGIYADHAVKDVIIRRNYIHDNAGNGISVNIVNGSQVYNNIVVNNATDSAISSGIHYRKQLTGTHVLYGNTIINNGDYGVRFPDFNSTATLTIRNNIITDHVEYGISLDNAGELTITEDYNDIYDNGARDQNITDGANTITSDPVFVSATGYQLKSTSPAIGAGTDLGATYSIGYAGNDQYDCGDWDIGAFPYCVGARAAYSASGAVIDYVPSGDGADILQME